MNRFLFYSILLFLPVLGNAQETEKIDFKSKLKAITNGYFLAYNEHNVDKILRFYDPNAVLIDKYLNNTVTGQKEFKRVATEAFQGPSPLYKNLHFKIYGMEQNDYTMIVRGEMQGIEWDRGYMANWKFRSEILFNEQGKIVKQIDYVDYPEDVLKYSKK